MKEADKRFKSDSFHKDRIGLCEIAFRVKTRREVDEFAKELKKNGAKILDSPREYSYCKGYYAVFFSDPDGIKLEIVYYPNQ